MKEGCNCLILCVSECPLVPIKLRIVRYLLCPNVASVCFNIKDSGSLFSQETQSLLCFLFWKRSFIINDSWWLWRLNIPRSHIFILMFQLQVYWEFAKVCSKIIHMPDQPRNTLFLNWNDSIILTYLFKLCAHLYYFSSLGSYNLYLKSKNALMMNTIREALFLLQMLEIM